MKLNNSKLDKLYGLAKPTGTYIFLNILTGFLTLGWILFRNDFFKTTEVLYLYLMIFFMQYATLVYIGLKSNHINTYTALATVILFAVPVMEQNAALFYRLSLIAFTIGFILEILKISFNFDLERYLASKIMLFRRKK